MSTGVGRFLRLLAPALLVAAIVGLHAPRLAAQGDEERAGARAAATEGAKAFRERRYAEAIDLFTRAESLVHAPPHLLYLSRAQAELGMLVQARENLLKVSRESLPANAPKAFHDAQDQAKEELQKLESRLPYVTINVEGGGAARAAVTEDGRRIPDALVGVPRPVNPGKHQYEALAEGLRGTGSIDLKEGERQSIVVKLEPAAGVSAPPAAGPGAGTAQPGEGQPGTTGTEGSVGLDTAGGGKKGLRIASYVAMGVGVVGIGVGIGFALQAGNKQSEGDKVYDDNRCAQDLLQNEPDPCPPALEADIQALWDDATSARTVATVGFVVGGVALAGGVVMFIMSSGGSGNTKTALKSPPRPRVEPYVGLGQAGLHGTF